MEFKDRIKHLREEKGMSQTVLAAQFGLKEAGIKAWEMGRTKPNADTLIKLAEYFDCSTDYLLGLNNIKNNEEVKSVSDSIDELMKFLVLYDDHTAVIEALTQIYYTIGFLNSENMARSADLALTTMSAASNDTLLRLTDKTVSDDNAIEHFARCVKSLDRFHKYTNALISFYYDALAQEAERYALKICSEKDKPIIKNMFSTLIDFRSITISLRDIRNGLNALTAEYGIGE